MSKVPVICKQCGKHSDVALTTIDKLASGKQKLVCRCGSTDVDLLDPKSAGFDFMDFVNQPAENGPWEDEVSYPVKWEVEKDHLGRDIHVAFQENNRSAQYQIRPIQPQENGPITGYIIRASQPSWGIQPSGETFSSVEEAKANVEKTVGDTLQKQTSRRKQASGGIYVDDLVKLKDGSIAKVLDLIWSERDWDSNDSTPKELKVSIEFPIDNSAGPKFIPFDDVVGVTDENEIYLAKQKARGHNNGYQASRRKLASLIWDFTDRDQDEFIDRSAKATYTSPDGGTYNLYAWTFGVTTRGDVETTWSVTPMGSNTVDGGKGTANNLTSAMQMAEDFARSLPAYNDDENEAWQRRTYSRRKLAYEGDPWDSPLVNYIDQLMDEGRNIYIHGWTNDGSHALVVDADNDQVSVASAHTTNGLGRWETSKANYMNDIGMWSERFPRRASLDKSASDQPKVGDRVYWEPKGRDQWEEGVEEASYGTITGVDGQFVSADLDNGVVIFRAPIGGTMKLVASKSASGFDLPMGDLDTEPDESEIDAEVDKTPDPGDMPKASDGLVPAEGRKVARIAQRILKANPGIPPIEARQIAREALKLKGSK